MKIAFGVRLTIERGRLALEFASKRTGTRRLGRPDTRSSPETIWRTLTAEQRQGFEREAAEVAQLEEWFRL